MKMSRERRSRQRYPIDLPLDFKVIKKKLVTDTGVGRTLNMSSGGVAFISGETFRPGAFVQLYISCPFLLNDGIPIKLVVDGEVVRSVGEFTAVRGIRHEFRVQKK